MKLLIVTELYTPSTGGQEQRYTELAEALVEAGHHVIIFCIGHASDLPAEEMRHGVRISRYPPAPNYRKPWIKATRRQLWPLLRFSFRARRLMREIQPDAVLFNQWPLAHVLLAPRAQRRIGILDWCEVRHSALFTVIQRYFPRLVQANTAVSRAVQAHIAGASGREVALVPSGVHCARYRNAPRAERQGLLYLGRVTEHKNLFMLIAVFDLLRSRGYRHGLTIAGSGPAMEPLERRVADSPNASVITLLGHVPDSQKVELLASSEILVITSRREGFPRVLAEAMASGLPTVTADYPGNGTVAVVREYGCGAVCAGNPLDLALTVEAVLGDWSRYSEAGLRRCHELDWGRVVSEVDKLAHRVRQEALGRVVAG